MLPLFHISQLRKRRVKYDYFHLSVMPTELTQEQLFQYSRAYILHLLGKCIMPNSSGNRIHNMYFPLLEDMDTINSYSWSSACLTQL
jgi:hypothetical protein